MSNIGQRKPGALYSISEEIFNAITHGIGAGMAIAGLVVLLVCSKDPWQAVSSAIYGSSMIFLFLMSCMYHALANPKAKKVFRVFDHTSIFFLIAGTYTPFTLVTLRGWVGWTIFGVVWGVAVLGIVLNAVSIEKFKVISMVGYIASGWCVVAAIVPMVQRMEWPGLVLLLAGGVFYTAGLIFYRKKEIRYMHSIWHLFVLAGAILHYFCILFYVIG